VNHTEHEIRGRIKIIYTSQGRMIYLTDSSGKELGEVNLADEVDLTSLLEQVDSDGELE